MLNQIHYQFSGDFLREAYLAHYYYIVYQRHATISSPCLHSFADDAKCFKDHLEATLLLNSLCPQWALNVSQNLKRWCHHTRQTARVRRAQAIILSRAYKILELLQRSFSSSTSMLEEGHYISRLQDRTWCTNGGVLGVLVSLLQVSLLQFGVLQFGPVYPSLVHSRLVY